MFHFMAENHDDAGLCLPAEAVLPPGSAPEGIGFLTIHVFPCSYRAADGAGPSASVGGASPGRRHPQMARRMAEGMREARVLRAAGLWQAAAHPGTQRRRDH